MLPHTARNIEAACRTIAAHYSRERGLWTHAAFDWINQTLFGGELPYPLIVIGLTAHGACLGWTISTDSRPPTIMLHPSLWASAASACAGPIEGKSGSWGSGLHWMVAPTRRN